MSLASDSRPIWRWSKRILRGILWLFIGCATLLLLVDAVENWRGQRRWQAYKQKLEVQGERLDLAAYLPPPLPEEKNFAFNPLFKPMWQQQAWYFGANRAKSYPPLDLDTIMHDLAMPGSTNHYPIYKPMLTAELGHWARFYRGNTNYPQAPNTATPAQTVIAALSKYDAPLNTLRAAAAARPQCRHPRRYADLRNMRVDDLARLKKLVETLNLRAVAFLGDGNPDAAFEELKLGLFLGDTLNADALWISQIVRRSIHAAILEVIQDGWFHRDWRESHCQWFSQYFLAQNYLADAMRVIRAERSMAIESSAMYQQERNSHRFFHSPNRWEIWAFKYGPSGWFQQNLYWQTWLYNEAGLAAMDAEARRVSPQKVSAALEAFQREARWQDSFITKLATNAVAGLARGPARVQTLGDVAAVCCAVERHLAAEGHLPEKLAALVPKYLPRLPHDVITGEPLRYLRRGPHDYSVYGVGWDGKDDGGRYNPETREGDWVWPGTFNLPRNYM